YLYQLPTTGLRFFTVYGPWGRPDMALFTFTQAMLASEPIDVYNGGDLSRDFTYIDDIVEGIIRVQNMPPSPNPNWSVETGTPASSSAPYRVFNIGHGRPVQLLDFITALEQVLGIQAKKRLLPMQPGDVHSTWADTQELFNAVGFQPQVDINTGVARFVDWYRSYYRC
ncbi:NAD-dependent epimerase/dehydratase family protein, partial [Shewanella sp.]